MRAFTLHKGHLFGKPEVKHNTGNLGIDASMILKWIPEK
jgi:hypothetical protein